MRLVIHSEGAAKAGLKRYNGRGIFSSIGRKLFLSGLKKVINAEEKKEYPQNFVDTVVNRRACPIKKKSKKVTTEKHVRTQKKGVVKRKLSPNTTATFSPPSKARKFSPPSKARKYSTNVTNHLINRGSGIVLD